MYLTWEQCVSNYEIPVQWVCGSNLGPVKLNTVLPMAHHRSDISLKRIVSPWHNDAEIGPANSLHALA